MKITLDSFAPLPKKPPEWHRRQVERHMTEMFRPAVLVSYVEGHLFGPLK